MSHLQPVLNLPFHQAQLQWMIDLTNHRIQLLDPFFRFLNYFDTPYFFFLLIPIIWLGYSYQWGIRIFYWFTISNLTNSYAKYLFGWPRPSTDLPEIGFFHPHSNGFPSGGAQTCVFLGVLLISYWKTPIAWVVGIFYILLVSFSRLYIGVHYPIDILGGWLLAFILLFIFFKIGKPLEHFLNKMRPIQRLALSVVIPLGLMLLIPTPPIYYIMGSCIGVGVGAHFSLQYHLFLLKPKSLIEGMGRAFIGIAILFALVFLWQDPSSQSFFKSFVLALFMSLAASPICKWFIKQ